MNLLLHHFWKDVRHVRWGLMVWGVLVLFRAVVAVVGAWEVDELTRDFMTILSFLLPSLQSLLLVVLVPWLLQDEPAVGTTAFWLTRPLTANFVLWSKGFFVAALIVGPLVGVELMVMALNAVDARYLALAVPEIVLRTLAVVLPLAVVAAITPSLGLYALWLIGIFVGITVFSMLMMFSVMYVSDENLSFLPPSDTLAASSQIISALLYVLVGTALVVWQYRRRATRQTVIAGAVLMLVAFNTSLFWRFDFFERELPEARALELPVEEVRVIADLRSLHTTRIASVRDRDEPRREVIMGLALVGLPDGYVAAPRTIEARAVFADGTDVRETLQPRGFRLGQGLSAEAIIRGTLPSVRQIGTVGGNPSLTEVLRLKEAQAERLAEVAFDLDLEIDWEILKGRVDYRLPLREGSDHREKGRRETIRSFSRLGKEVTVTLLVRNVQLLFAPEVGGSESLASVDPGGALYGLYHPERKEFWVGKPELDWQASILKGQQFIIRTQKIFFLWTGREESPVDDAWLERAELVRLTSHPVAELTRETRLSGVLLKEAN